MGKGSALKTGFEALHDIQSEAYLHLTGGEGLESGVESQNGQGIIVTIDTDGQHDPADIPKLVEPIHRGEAGMINGSRYLNGNGKDTPFYRRIGQKVSDTATNLDKGLDITIVVQTLNIRYLHMISL